MQIKKDGTEKEMPPKEGIIRVILSQQGKKAIISTGHKIEKNDWENGKPKPIAKNANVNLYLNKYKNAFDNCFVKVTTKFIIQFLTPGPR